MMPERPQAQGDTPRERAARFCEAYGLERPILLAPMAGACPPALSAAVADAGGMGAMGAVATEPEGILAWARLFRAASRGPFQLNVWVPDPPPPQAASPDARTTAAAVAPRARRALRPDAALRRSRPVWTTLSDTLQPPPLASSDPGAATVRLVDDLHPVQGL